ncbi:collagen alpha-1(I) chain-like [Corvus kubaryi]|uniref:collagen alpha-1(I) chain-like n=1 Tax=Corvus kubaryi TaxID=68294 RepID=UPI001C05DF4E|nr:collagen alpha-1(I) chain-like [Corvus kubaryi]
MDRKSIVELKHVLQLTASREILSQKGRNLRKQTRFIPLLETHSSIKTPRTCSGPGARQWLHSSRHRREAVHEPPFAQTPRHRCPAPRRGKSLHEPAKRSGGAGGGGHEAASSRLPLQGSGSRGRCHTWPVPQHRPGCHPPGRETADTSPALRGQPPRAPSAAAGGMAGGHRYLRSCPGCGSRGSAAERWAIFGPEPPSPRGRQEVTRGPGAGGRAGAQQNGGGKEGGEDAPPGRQHRDPAAPPAPATAYGAILTGPAESRSGGRTPTMPRAAGASRAAVPGQAPPRARGQEPGRERAAGAGRAPSEAPFRAWKTPLTYPSKPLKPRSIKAQIHFNTDLLTSAGDGGLLRPSRAGAKKSLMEGLRGLQAWDCRMHARMQSNPVAKIGSFTLCARGQSTHSRDEQIPHMNERT